MKRAHGRAAGRGLWLAAGGRSPYAGSAFHVPPLLLPLLGPVARHPVLYVIPFAAADCIAALCLMLTAAALLQRQALEPHDAVYLRGTRAIVKPCRSEQTLQN